MSSEKQRRLSAVMFTDMVGYSALMQENEALGLDLLDEHRTIVRALLAQHGGREIDTAGDAFFAEFGSALAAVECAIEIQQSFHDRNVEAEESHKILLRIGLHLGDVVHSGDQVHGDGVNIAARMEPLARAGSICLSEDIARQVHNKISLPLAPIGDRQLKNIRLPMVAYRVIMPWEDSTGAASPFLDASRSRGQHPESDNGADDSKRSRRFWQAAIGVIVLAAVAWVGIRGSILDPDPISSTVSASAVAVLPFSVQGNPDFAYLGQGMVDLLSTKLDGAGELRSIDARAVLGLVEQSGHDTFDPGRGQEIAENLGAGTFVLGNIVEVAGKLRIDATVYSSTSSQPLEQGSVEGDADNIFALLDALAAQLIVVERSGLGTLEQITTSSFEALKHYLQGVSAFRAARFQLASDELTQAVELDSTFALAWYQLSSTAEWLYNGDLALLSAENALRHRDRLSERGRRSVEALHASKSGRNRVAIQRYRDIVTSYPDDVEAWYQLAELQFHTGPLIGARITESLPAWEQLLFFEPDQITALIHVSRIAAANNDWARFDSMATRVIELEPAAERNVELQAHMALRNLGDVPSGDFAESLRNASDDLLAEVAWSLGSFRDHPDFTGAMVPFLTESTRSESSRSLGHLIQGHLEIARGRIASAREAFERAEQVGYPAVPVHQTLVSILPFRKPTGKEAATALNEIQSWDTAASWPSGVMSVWYHIPEPQLVQFKHYLEGVLLAMGGFAAAANRSATSLAAVKSSEQYGSVGSDLSQAVRAQIWLEAGDSDDAEQILAGIERSVWYQFGLTNPLGSLPRERYMLGQLLEDRGQYLEAIEVMEFPRQSSIFDWPYVAPSHLRRATSFEAMGDTEAAAHHYRRFVELWSDCDPEFQPLVDFARSKLAG